MKDKSMEQVIAAVIQQCGCRLAFAPGANVKDGTRLPSTHPQACISVDVIHLGGKKYIHSSGECTTWPEVACIFNEAMGIRIGVLKHVQHLRHGPSNMVQCDNGYNDAESDAFCSETRPEQVVVAPSDHKRTALSKTRILRCVPPTIAFDVAEKETLGRCLCRSSAR